jgi:hypothetical protein
MDSQHGKTNMQKRGGPVRLSFILIVALMLPLILGLRRGEPGSGGCGGPSQPRQVGFLFAGGSGRTIRLSPNRTQDIAVTPTANRVSYLGDESSILYAWEEANSGELLIGRHYFGACQDEGQTTSRADFLRFNASDIGLGRGIPIVRQYDRGQCSAFQLWEPFRDKLKAALDEALETEGVLRLGNSTLTPLIMLNPATTYPGDTNDTFRFTRMYSISRGPLGFYLRVRIEGGFRTGQTGGATFVPTMITVRNPDDQIDVATSMLETRLNASLATSLNNALDDALFQRLPARQRSLSTCAPSAPSEPARCLELFNSIFRDVLHTPITLSPAQVRCNRRPSDTGSRGFCEFRLNVLRTQEYPEGFEFVLSEVGNDQGWRLIALAGDEVQDNMCYGARPPVSRTNGTTIGTVHRFDAP